MNYLPHVARFLIGAPFVMAGVNKVTGFAGTQGFMESVGLPMAGVLLVLTIIVEIVGGLSVIFNKYAFWGAGALAGFTVIATLVFHMDFSSDPNQILFATKNAAWLGGLLLVMHMSCKDKKPASEATGQHIA